MGNQVEIFFVFFRNDVLMTKMVGGSGGIMFEPGGVFKGKERSFTTAVRRWSYEPLCTRECRTMHTKKPTIIPHACVDSSSREKSRQTDSPLAQRASVKRLLH